MHFMKTELHYRIYNTHNLCPSRVIRIQSTLQLYFLQIRFNIVLPATPSFCKWSLSITSHQQIPLCTSCMSHTCHMPRPSHSSWFNDPNNIGWGANYAVFSSPYHLVPLRPKYIPQHPLLKLFQPLFLPEYERPSFIPMKNNMQN